MSEQEKNSGGGADLSVVVVDTASRHKQPFHSIDMQEEVHKELQHKHSRAPAVPSVNEELKDNTNLESIAKNESMSSEAYKHNVAKILSSGQNKRRASSPESLKLAPITADVKKESLKQPIPAVVPSIESDTTHAPKKKLQEKTEDEDSITEEIADLRTAEAAKVSSEWSNRNEFHVKKVSWSNDDYLSKETSAKQCRLERKSSLGPCFRAAAPFGRPSGISLCLKKPLIEEDNENYSPKKSTINISLSKRCLVNKTIYWDVKECVDNQVLEVPVKPKKTLLCTLSEKMSMMSNRIKNVF